MCRITQGTQGTTIRIRTINTRGIKTDIKLNLAATDMESFKITLLAIHETHLTGSGIRTIKTKYGDNFDFMVMVT